MTQLRLLNHYVHPHHLSGTIIEARLSGVSVGEVCDVRRHWRENEVLARAVVVGFRGDMAILSLMGNAKGLSRESVLVPTGGALTVRLNDGVLGSVLDSNGICIARLSEPKTSIRADRWCALDAAPPTFEKRASIRQKFHSGIGVVDALMTCGIGQRLGIFASAGAGKTSFVNMLIQHATADVFVIGLIGERGREVTEFVETLKRSPRRSRCVVVYATSDASSVDRRNAALLATTVAEYYRDHGSQVVLLQDSLTRYARALRDVALAAGEPPARRGYPASVFEALPRLLERPGITTDGSITAFYTILLESEDEADPIAEEIRSILDGHIYLSRKLASQNHYPAVDVLRSLSRVASQVCDATQLRNASSIRGKLSRIEELQLMLDMGEYRPGENIQNDRLMEQRDALFSWLRQMPDELSNEAATLEKMHALAE